MSKVILDTEENVSITRTRSKSVNEYKMDGEVFRAFGSDPPREISDFLRIGEVNLHRRGQSVLTMRPAERAKFINDITGHHIIDSAISSSNRSVTSKKDDLARNKDELNKLDLKIKNLDWMEEAGTKLDAAEKIETRIERVRDDIAEIEIDLETLRKLETSIAEYDRIIDYEAKVKDALALARQIQNEQEKIDEINALAARASSLRAKHKEAESIVKSLTKKWDKSMEGACPLCGRRPR